MSKVTEDGIRASLAQPEPAVGVMLDDSIANAVRNAGHVATDADEEIKQLKEVK